MCSGSISPDTLFLLVFTPLVFLLDTDGDHIVVDVHLNVVLVHTRQFRPNLKCVLELLQTQDDSVAYRRLAPQFCECTTSLPPSHQGACPCRFCRFREQRLEWGSRTEQKRPDHR